MRTHSLFSVASIALLMAVSLNVQARDTRHLFSIEEALNSATFQGRLDPNIRFYFGDQAHPEPLQMRGEYVSNKKTNAFNKSDQEACEWVLLSALLSLEQRARAEGGNAVVNVRSYYKKDEFSSTTEYECHAGAIMAGVALIGEVATLPE